MKTETLHPVADYIDYLFNNFIVPEEGFGWQGDGLPYFDTANPRQATIGYGFNIEVRDYLLLVLYEMGIVHSGLTTEEINRRIDAFTTAINNTPDTGDRLTTTNQLRINLNQVASQYGVAEFSIDRNQGYNIYREIILGCNVVSTDGNIYVQGKQERLDALLTDPITNHNTLAHNSKEYVAVMSLFYTAETLVDSPRRLLANAIINDNRAEAWYEIRYNSNADGQHAARRYREANLFWLYDTGNITVAGAKEIMRMYTIHETDITSYEGQYGHQRPADVPSINDFDGIRAAKQYLVAQFANGTTIDGKVIVGAGLDSYAYLEGNNINDPETELTGGEKNDLIFGEKGNDTLNGAGGADVMIGGLGDDTYKVDNSADVIIENDGQGTDLVESTADNYTLPDNVENLTLMGTANIDGTGNGLDNVITGNTGNNRLDGGGGNDTLDGVAGHNTLSGGAGDDILYGYDGDDFLWGDAGIDTLFGGGGNNNMSGGAGDDYLLSGDGDDFLFGDDGNDTLYGGAGNNYMEGGAGNDEINGGADNDTIYGGANDDYIYGGSGNDDLYSGAGNKDTFVDSEGVDRYYIDARSATITDTDGAGQVFSGRGQLKGGKQLKDADGNPLDIYIDGSGNLYKWDGEDGSTLTIESSSHITVDNFYQGKLEIYLDPTPYETPLALFDTAEIRRSPIIVDLDGDGVETINIYNKGTFFDHDANGFRELTGWVSADDGLLVMDRDGNGTIDSGKELFGNATLLNNGTKAANGFQALAELDSNLDGTIDANDAAYMQLRIWQDIDGDGYSSVDELKTLSELGIESIKTSYTETITNITDATGNIISLSALAGLDFNNDGKIDANDATYTQLRIWDDINGDGYSSGDELKTLPELGINSINTELINHITDADGNILSLSELAKADSNYDGKIDANDNGYTQLRMWDDINWDGYISVDELTTLSGQVIKYINKGSIEDNTYVIDVNGNTIKEYGAFTRTDGTTGSTADVWFNADKMYTVATEWLDVSEEIAALPDLAGTGTVYSLHQAMVHDESGHLKNLVEQFAAETNASVRHTLVTQILYAWTGVENIDPLSRSSSHFYGNAIGDARKLATLEAFVGRPYLGTWCGLTRDPNPHGKAAKFLLQAFDELVDRTYSQLMAQTHFKDLLNSISLTWNNDTNQFDWDVNATRDALQALYNADPNNALLAMSEFADILYLAGAGGRQALQALHAQGDLTGDDDFLRFLATLWPSATVGDAGDNKLQGTNNADHLYGMGGNDTLSSGGGDDYLYGGAGNDWLRGGAGNDTLEGSADNDALSGGAGNDTYLFGRGSGQDVIAENESDPNWGNKVDTILLDHDISPADVTFLRDNQDLVLSINGTSDTMTVRNWFVDNPKFWHVEQVQFGDGTVWDEYTIERIFLQGTPGNDYLIGYPTADMITGLEGNDRLYGYAADDTLDGGAGNDVLQGGDDNDVLEGGDGGDQLYGQAGNDVLHGGEGIDYLNGGAGDDTLDGGAGNDSLYGGIGRYDNNYWWYYHDDANGNDTYLFGRGSGQDTIIDHDTTAGNVDTILLNSDISPADVTLRRSGDNLVFSINDTSDTLTVKYWFADESGAYQVEHIQFGDGTVWDADTVKQMVLVGTSGDDVLIGYSTADTISGLEGNDRLYGRAGDDTLDGGPGNDRLNGEDGNDVLRGGEGIDSLRGGAGDDTLDGGAGNETLYGETGNDTYLFGRGSDQDFISDHDTTAGNIDTILLNSDISPADVTLRRDYGNLVLTINDTTDKLTVGAWFYDESGSYQVEHIQFGDGTLWDADTIKQMMLQGTSGDDLLIGYSTGDTISGLEGNDRLYGRAGDDTLDGGPGNDRLNGEDGNDVLRGGEGIDTLRGGTGDDTLDGGAGNDSLVGGTGFSYSYWYSPQYDDANGNDTYLFGRGSSQDTIYDHDTTAGNVDTILLNSDISPADVTLRRSGDNLVLSINDTTDKLIVSKWFADEAGAYQVEHVQFGDGTLWDADTIKQMVLVGTFGNDLLIGYSTGDTISGLEGNDRLYGRAGDDTLDGGAGNDSLYGETGNDTYLFGRGSGQDFIYDHDTTAGNVDTILLNSDISPADVTLRRNGDDLVLSINDTSDTMMVSNWFLDEAADYQIENIQFADGTVWDVATIKQMVLQGTPGDDYIVGYSSDDTLDGGAGNDTVIGNKGKDTYIFGRGYGRDIIIDADNTPGNTDTVVLAADVLPSDVTLKRGGDDLFVMINDTSERLQIKDWFASDDNKVEYIQFADGTVWDAEVMQNAIDYPTDTDDYLVGTPLADVIDGGGGNDEIYGLEDNDTLYGGTGDDYIDGGDGDNIIDGGDGNDNLYGQYGSDTIYGGAGNDYIAGGHGYFNELYGGDGIDTLYGGSSINVMNGGAGDDYIDGSSYSSSENLYIVNRGSGFDYIDVSATLDDGYGGPVFTDAVVFGEGITPDDLSVQISEGDGGGGPVMTVANGDGYGGSISNLLAIGIGDNEGMLISASATGGEGYGGSVSIADLKVQDFFFEDSQELLTLDQILARADGGIIGEQWGTDGDDSLPGSVANDQIYGYSGDDRIDGRDNEDFLRGDDGSDAISAGPGEDYVLGGSGDDVMAGGKENDELYGESGNDVYCFNRGDGHDYIYNYPGISSGEIDTISFGVDINPADIAAYVNSYGNLVLTINGTDDDIAVEWFDPNTHEEYTDSGLARVQFIDEAGSSRIFDLAGVVSALKDSILSADIDNPVSLFTDATSSFELTGSVTQAGGDYAVAYAQTGDLFAVPTYYYGDFGDDVINGRAGDDYIDAGEGNNIINAGDGNNEVIAGNGNDVINAGKGNDLILPGGGNDTVHAGAGDDSVAGGSGTDIIYAGDGNDEIDGWTGNDTLIGGAGDDTYYYDIGYGTVTIDDLADASGGNRIVFGSTITPDDLSLAVEEDYLIVNVGNNTEDRIRLTHFDPEDAYGPHAVDIYEFADGQLLTYSQLMDKGFDFIGTEGDDVMIGTGASDRINALGGDDVLIGGEGDDIVDGGSGNDTYIFNLGDGIDTINDQAFVNAGNVVQFGEGITLSDLTLTAEQNTLIIQVGQEGDALRLEGFNPDDVFGNRAVDAFRFADGTTVDYDQLLSMKGFSFSGTTGGDTLSGTEGDDVMIGTGASDLINALGGDDVLIGGEGDDILDGGSGNDTYIFNLGDGIDTINDQAFINAGNVVQFGEGITLSDLTLTAEQNTLIIQVGQEGDALRLEGFNPDDVFGNRAVDAFRFADGTTVDYDQLLSMKGFSFSGTTGGDTLSGTSINDVFQGGLGNDTLFGGMGSDTYLFNSGDGVDTIDDAASPDQPNTLMFGAGITPADIHLDHDLTSGELIINIGATGDSVRLKNFDAVDPYGPHAVEYFQFADGQVLTYSQLIDLGFDINGTTGDDNLIGTATVDRISGDAGNDTLSGGAGTDALAGGLGDDTYLFNLGDGVDVIDDVATASAGNTLEFGPDITFTDISLAYSGDTMVIYVGDNGDEVHLKGFDPNAADTGSRAVQSFRFADGTTISYEELLQKTFVVQGDVGDDYLIGTNVGDRLSGFEGNDTLIGGAGYDALLGGTGDDMLIGGAGSDLYVFYLGDGVDTIDDMFTPAEGNLILFGNDITPDDLTFVQNDGVLTIYYGNNGDAVNLLNFDQDGIAGSPAIQMLEFADGTQMHLLNRPPVMLNPIPDQTTMEDAAFSFIIPADTFADPDLGDTLTYRVTLADGTALPAWLSFDPATMTFSGTPTNDDVGTLSLKVTATDTSLASVSNEFNVTVSNVNDAPVVANPISDQTTMEDAAFSFTIPANTFADVDLGDTLTYSATLSDGSALPAWLSFDPATRTFSGTPANDNVGVLALKVTATDTGGASVSDEFDVAIENVNDPPIVANPIGDQTTLEDAAFSFTVPADTFADPDLGDTLTYRATLADGTALPVWLSFDPATMTFSGTPTNDDVGTLSLKVTATDTSLASVSNEFNVTVSNVNDAPVVANPIADQTTLEDAVFNFTVPADTFADVDLDDSLTYSATLADGTALPSWLTFDPATMTFSGTPANEDVGTLSLKITATDSVGASVSDEFNVTVENVNDAPVVANPIADQTTLEDEVFTFTVPADTFADVDLGDSLTYEATLADGTALPAWLSFDPATMTFSGTPANEDVGILSLKVTATDTGGASVSDAFNITVESKAVVTYGTDHFDFIFTGLDNDLIYALGGSDIVYSDEGNDTIYGGNGYDVIFGGAGNDKLYGENDNDLLYGDSGNDTLDGGTDADLMFGGAGNDTYIVDNPYDIVGEFCYEGTDTVQSSITYTLGYNVENLTLTGTAAINGTGNALDNVLIGNSGENTLTGGAGNDTLDGGAGNDSLIGGTGNDIYAFMRGYGQDTITDYDTTAGNSDEVKFGSDINPIDLILVNNGNDLDIQINDSTDLLTVLNQNAGSANQVEVFEAGDGSRLLSSQVDLLIQAMAGFSAENGGMSWEQLIDQKPVEVQQILASYWQPSQ